MSLAEALKLREEYIYLLGTLYKRVGTANFYISDILPVPESKTPSEIYEEYYNQYKKDATVTALQYDREDFTMWVFAYHSPSGDMLNEPLETFLKR